MIINTSTKCCTHIFALLLGFFFGSSQLSAKRQAFCRIRVNSSKTVLSNSLTEVCKADLPFADQLYRNVRPACIHRTDESSLLICAIEGCIHQPTPPPFGSVNVPISTSRCMYLDAKRCDSGPYGSDFSLALRAVLGARIPDTSGILL